jgi:monodehydroascorbate reductase (NADH)
VVGVVLDNGTTLPADLVVVGVGARPNSELFQGQLELGPGGGITVDATLATSVPGVWAIGDVASFPLACEGGALSRQEHVTHARQSAAHVGATLMGECPRSRPPMMQRIFFWQWSPSWPPAVCCLPVKAYRCAVQPVFQQHMGDAAETKCSAKT